MKTIPMVIQVTKATKLKALRNRASKERERHQCRTTQLYTFKELGESLALKDMDGLTAFKNITLR